MTADKASKRERLKAHLPRILRSPSREPKPTKSSQNDDTNSGIRSSVDNRSTASPEPGTAAPKSVWEEAWVSLEAEEPSLFQNYQQYLLDESNANAKSKTDQLSSKEKTEQLLRTVEGKVAVARTKLQGDRFSSKVHRFVDGTIEYILKGSEFISVLASREPHAALAWAGVSVILPFLLNPNVESEAALEGLADTSRILCRFAVIENDMYKESATSALSHTENSKLKAQLRKYLIELYSKIILFHIQLILRYERAAVTQYFRDVVQVDDWQSKVVEIKALEESNLKDINILGHHILLHVQSIIEQQDQQISVGFANMTKNLAGLEAGIKTIRAENKAHQDTSADKDIVNAFKIDTNYVLQKDRNGVCAPDTGQWFFHHPEYQAFHDAKGLQLLFVTAEAGGGKSTIMRTFVDRLQESDDRSLVAYFFFKDDDDQLRSYDDALSSIIYQLFVQERGLIKPARSLYQRYGLKFVVTSRPYQDQNHPYADLVVSDTIRHLAGENAKVQADIQTVIRFKAEELAKKRQLSQSTLDILVDSISSQNMQTRSFLAVRMAFELLDSHNMMHKGAGERTIPELKVLYALTQPANSAVGPPQSYDDLELPTDDEEFKQLIRARCGLFITFVRNSVHLFHQTAREHLMANLDTTAHSSLDGTLVPSTLALHTPDKSIQQFSWRGCITEADANLVMLTICLDLFCFKISKSWVLDVFDSLNAGNEFYDDIKAFLQDRPVFQYAAFNWYEHAILGGDGAQATLCIARYAGVLDVNKTSFWAWFLVLADYIGSSRGKPQSLISSVWEEDYKKHRISHEFGLILREVCLTKLFAMDHKIHDLLGDPSLPLHEATSNAKRPTWTAGNGYELIDKYHLAYGEYQYTSSGRAVQCIEHGQLERAEKLSTNIPIPTMIWTCISDGAPNALKHVLADIKDIEWLQEVPEHLMYQRKLWKGSSTASGKDLRKDREKGWDKPCPTSFAATSRAMTFATSGELFNVLADWMEASSHVNDYAQKIWEAGGFLEPLLCRRLVNAGASIDIELWTGRRTALQIAAALWEHDAVETLIELGADSSSHDSHGRIALHWFLSGPESPIGDGHTSIWIDSKSGFSRLPVRDQQRYRKSRIASTLKALSRIQTSQVSPLEATDASGKTPLMLALQSSPTATKALLDAGADVERKDRWGRTPLIYFFCGAFNGRPTSILKHILNARANNLSSDASGHTVLHYWARQLLAMEMGSLYAGFNSYNKAFDILTSTGALSDDNILIQELTPLKIPLSAAARLCNTKLCWALLKTGADPNKHGLYIETSLIQQNGSESMDLADLNWKPLMIALQSRAYTTTALLIAYGADVTYKTPTRKRTKFGKYRMKKWGLTPLHLAVGGSIRYHSYEVGLNTGGLSRGCSFRAVGNPEHKIEKASPMSTLAKHQERTYKNSPSYKRFYKDVSSDSEYEIKKSTFHNDSTGKNLLPYDKASETMLSSESFSDPLFKIITDNEQTKDARQKALVELFLKKGAPVNTKTQEGITPLICVFSSPDLARLLIQHGADPNIASTEGSTCLMRAAANNELEIAEILLTAGANPNAQTNVPPLIKRKCASFIERSTFTFHSCDANLSALAVAAERGHYAIVELLIKHGADPNLPIEHHAHGRLPSKRDQRRRARGFEEPESSESEVEEEQWKGYISIATALTWARDEVKELLLRNGADPGKEEPLRECDCEVIERRKDRGWNGSDDEYPTKSESEGTDAALRKHRNRVEMVKWDGDSD
ncbi:hypothetical protein N0V90_009737 [Kalmusia sp. IMI 367209]|nr:hypothetical protein N0V90_009737 [Kalmusia sp. IMI 367209]